MIPFLKDKQDFIIPNKFKNRLINNFKKLNENEKYSYLIKFVDMLFIYNDTNFKNLKNSFHPFSKFKILKKIVNYLFLISIFYNLLFKFTIFVSNSRLEIVFTNGFFMNVYSRNPLCPMMILLVAII